MLRKPKAVAVIVSGYLLLYYILFLAGASLEVLFGMFLCSPFLLVWLVITVLKDKEYTGKELKEEEEWGYADKEKHSFNRR